MIRFDFKFYTEVKYLKLYNKNDTFVSPNSLKCNISTMNNGPIALNFFSEAQSQ